LTMAAKKTATEAEAAPAAEAPAESSTERRVTDGCLVAKFDGSTVSVEKAAGATCSCTLDLAAMPLESAKNVARVLSTLVSQQAQ